MSLTTWLKSKLSQSKSPPKEAPPSIREKNVVTQLPTETDAQYLERIHSGIAESQLKSDMYTLCFEFTELNTYNLKENHQYSEEEFEKVKEHFLERVRKFYPSIPEENYQEIEQIILEIPYTDTRQYLTANTCRLFKLITGEDLLI